MKTLLGLLTLAAVVGLLLLTAGAARLSARVTWCGLLFIGAAGALAFFLKGNT